MNAPRAVSFDIWNTLLKPNPAFRRTRAEALARLYGVTPEEAQQACAAADNALDAETERTGIDAGCEDRIARIAAILGKPVPDADTLARAADEIQSIFLADPPSLLEGNATLETVRALKEAGVPVYLVSNTGFIRGDTMRVALREMGILEEGDPGIFSNECQGAAKPSPEIFRLLERYGADLHTTLHVGDNARADYAGARGAGMQAVLLDRGNRSTDDETERVRSLAEIPGLLGLARRA